MTPAAALAAVASPPATADWRKRLPVLGGELVTLRELELRDAPSLFAMLSAEEVARVISPPPTTVEGFGAVQEGVLRGSFVRNGKPLDQFLWSILDSEWMQAKAVWGPRATVHARFQ